MIRIIFFDFDNTLYSHKSQSVPASAVNALRQLHDNGILLFMATGRNYEEMSRFPVPLELFDGFLLDNGQLCFDRKGEILFEMPLDEKAVRMAVDDFDKKERCVLLNNKEGQYANIIDDHLIYAQKCVSSPLPVIDCYHGEKLYMASYFGNREELQDVFERFADFKITYWNNNAVDVVSYGGGKDIGIKAVCDHYGISREETMSFGDWDNDIAMFRQTGLSVCMGNGMDKALEACDYITDDIDKDGVFKALKHFGII